VTFDPATASFPRAHLHRPRKGRWFQIFKPFDFEWNHAKLEIPNLPPQLVGLRIIHLTDLHVRGPWHDAYDRLLERIAAANADLLLFTGDFVDNKRNHTPALPSMRRLADGFHAKHGCYAILGNHDRMHFLPRLLETPLHAICGERRTIDIKGATVELIGLPGSIRKELPSAFAASMPPPPVAGDNTVRIVLSHFPDHLPRTAPLNPHIFLAGHTHGGQCCLPGGIPIIKHDSLPRRLCTGIHRVRDTWLVVGRGFGATTLPLRIFCPPEVIEIELAPFTPSPSGEDRDEGM
jgi:uncharacterized protein